VSLFAGQIVHCLRCAVPCRTGKPDPEARILQISEGPCGYCVNYDVTWFFMSTRPLLELIKGADGENMGVNALRLPHIQEQFAAVMRAGFAQVPPEAIDWLEIIANWYLPFPHVKRSKT
jgi:hypothetical protein